MFKIEIIHDIHEYINFLSKLPSEYKWFRGQSNASFRLTPSAMRNIYAIADQRGNLFDTPRIDGGSSGSNNEVVFLNVDRMVEEFKSQAKVYIGYDVANDLEWECIGQHYGLPTRLLDWTTNPIDALYFAVSDCEIGKTDEDDVEHFKSSGFSCSGGAIFIIDPVYINRYSAFADKPDKSRIADLVHDYDGLKNNRESIVPPICVAGMNKEKRICRQSGNFTMHSRLVWPLDYYNVYQDNMYKILIPYDCFEGIRKSLTYLNVTHDTVYVEDDDKDKIAKKIAEDTRNKFMKDLFG